VAVPTASITTITAAEEEEEEEEEGCAAEEAMLPPNEGRASTRQKDRLDEDNIRGSAG
jgi:hypothetical protein